MILRVGIDIGSTTVKVVVLDEDNKLLFRSYERHYSKARERACETLRSIEDMLRGKDVRLVVTGSAGLGVAKAAGLDFVQEVYDTAAAVNTYIPDTDAVIELGGEDAKMPPRLISTLSMVYQRPALNASMAILRPSPPSTVPSIFQPCWPAHAAVRAASAGMMRRFIVRIVCRIRR